MTKLSRHDMQDIVVSALVACGGRGSLIDVAKYIWTKHEADLRASGDIFFTWQYDMRWAATRLREAGILAAAEVSPRGVWEMKVR